jgi:hypothetical protein
LSFSLQTAAGGRLDKIFPVLQTPAQHRETFAKPSEIVHYSIEMRTLEKLTIKNFKSIHEEASWYALYAAVLWLFVLLFASLAPFEVKPAVRS